MTEVLIGLGSNLSFNGFDSIHILASACIILQKFLRNLSPSSVYKTAPMYLENQNDFYNLVIGASFDGNPEKLLEKLHVVENILGRNRAKEKRNGERTLDLDIELFGKETLNSAALIIPHERMLERAFVLKPFLELLSENADVKRSGQFLNDKLTFDSKIVSQKISKLSEQKIELYLEKQKFVKMIDDKSFIEFVEQKYGQEFGR